MAPTDPIPSQPSLLRDDFEDWSQERQERWLRQANEKFDRQKRRISPLLEWTERERAREKFDRIRDRSEEINLAVRSAGATSPLLDPARPFGGMPRPSPEAQPAVDLVGGLATFIAESDDSPGFTPAALQPTYLTLRNGRRLLFKTLVDQTGIVDDPEKKALRDVERQSLRQMSHTIAAALEGQGVTAYRNTAWACWRVGVHSLEVEGLPPFRNICLLPWVAARNRMASIKAVEWFLQCRTDYGRLVTFTNGPRCPVGQVGARFRSLHRRISQLNNQKFMRTAGAEIVFRSSELGSMEKTAGDPEAGGIEITPAGRLYHPHAHCILFLRNGRLPKDKWIVLLKRIHDFWGDVWDEGGLIRNPRELVKYVTKPNDMVRLSAEDPAELAELYRQLLGVHMVQCLGTLRRELSAHRRAGEELTKQSTNDGPVWVWIRNVQHCLASDSEPTRWRRADSLGPEGVALGGGAGKYADPADAPGERYASRHLVKKYLTADQHGPPDPETARKPVCKIVAVTLPRSGSSCVREPQLIVIGNHLDKAELLRDPIIDQLWRATQDEYMAGIRLAEAAHTRETYRQAYEVAAADAGRKAGIRLDTGTITVVPGPLPLWWDVPERRKPPDPPVWEPCPSPENELTPLSRS